MEKKVTETKPVEPQVINPPAIDRLSEEDLEQVTGGVSLNESATNYSRSQSDAQKTTAQNISA